MRMNLTGLADFANAQAAADGKPLEIPLDDIVPDPDNPRLADDENTPDALRAQEELDADVAERGIKSPISVRPHPTRPGKYIINYGHRRYRSARNNKHATIRSFVDERFDSYDQFNENELRTGLTVRAIALFIKSRLDKGDTKGEIARRMRKKSQNFITEHLALLDGPECVHYAYASGVTGARTLYDLQQAWQEFPEEIDAWVRTEQHIVRETIKAQLAMLRERRDQDRAGCEKHRSITEQIFRPDEKSSSSLVSSGSPLQKHPESPTDSSRPMSATQEFRPDEKVKPESRLHGTDETAFRPDEKLPASSVAAAPTSNLAPGATGGSKIQIRYRGLAGRIAPRATVLILLDGQTSPVEVPFSELAFEH